MKVKKHGGNVWTNNKNGPTLQRKYLDFSSNINIYAPKPFKNNDFLRKINEESRVYPHPSPLAWKKKIASVFRIPPKFIVPTAGAVEGIYEVARFFTGKNIMILSPTFSEYKTAFTKERVKVYENVLDVANWKKSFVNFAQNVPQNLDAVTLCNPNSPNGVKISWKNIDLLRKNLSDRTYLIIDTSFLDFCVEKPNYRKIIRLKKVILIHSLTKFFAIPGLRLGFIATKSKKIRQFLSKNEKPWTISAVSQIWLRCVFSQKLYRFLLKKNQVIHKRRKELHSSISKIDGLTPIKSDGNFILVLNNGSKEGFKFLVENLKKKGILIRDCSNFRGLENENYFRVSVKRKQDNKKLVKLLKKSVKKKT